MQIEKTRFLMVDDMESMRGIIKATLKSIGAENIIVGNDGYDGIKKLNTYPVDFIISDWDMPKVTGLQFLEFAKSRQEFKSLPFILLTASNDKQRVKSAIDLGVTDYLSKPFQPQALKLKIERALKRHYPSS